MDKKLIALAKAKLELFTNKELEDFIKNYSASKEKPKLVKSYKNLDDSYPSLKTSLDYKVIGYNNAYLGDKNHGGEKYTRCIISVYNMEIAPREMIIKVRWLCPSGVGDGSGRDFPDNSYTLTNKDIFEIKKIGSARNYLKKILGIKDELQFKNDKPYNLPFRPQK